MLLETKKRRCYAMCRRPVLMCNDSFPQKPRSAKQSDAERTTESEREVNSL